jgi:hypothetical protein
MLISAIIIQSAMSKETISNVKHTVEPQHWNQFFYVGMSVSACRAICWNDLRDHFLQHGTWSGHFYVTVSLITMYTSCKKHLNLVTVSLTLILHITYAFKLQTVKVNYQICEWIFIYLGPNSYPPNLLILCHWIVLCSHVIKPRLNTVPKLKQEWILKHDFAPVNVLPAFVLCVADIGMPCKASHNHSKIFLCLWH